MTTTHSSNKTTGVSSRARVKPTRQAQLRKLLARKSGVTIAQLQKTFGWHAVLGRYFIGDGARIVTVNTVNLQPNLRSTAPRAEVLGPRADTQFNIVCRH